MSFDYFDTVFQTYLVISVVYKGAGADPIIRYNSETVEASARQWVNVGTQGSGHSATPLIVAAGTKKGDVTVTASQT